MRKALSKQRILGRQVTIQGEQTRRSLYFQKQQTEFLRDQYEMRHKYLYMFPDQKDYQNKFEKISLYGQDHPIVGQTNNYKNSQLVLSVLEEYKPNVCVLGGMNRFDLKEMKHQYQIYSEQPIIYNKETDIPAKNRMMQFLEEDLDSSTLYFQIPDYNIFYRNDPIYKKCHMENYLTAGNYYCKSLDNYLLFGKPDLHLQMEDIALRFDIQQLREIFDHIISYIYEQSVKNNWEPNFENPFILEMIKSAAKTLYGSVLYEKQVLHSASIFKKSARMFKKSGMVIDQELLPQVKDMVYQNIIPEYDMIYRQYLDSSQHERLVSERYAKVQKYFKDDVDRQQILNELKEFNSKYDYTSELVYYENLQKNNVNPEEIIEKYAILSYIFDNNYKNYLMNGVNPFKVTIFKDLLKDYSIEQMLEIFQKTKQNYFIEIHQLQNHIIKQMEFSKDKGRYIIQSHNEHVRDIKNKQIGQQYQFAIGQKTKMKRLALSVDILMLKGINQKEQIEAVKSVISGYFQEETLNQFNQLLMEANLELGGIIKFPKKYQRYLSYLSNIKKQEMIQQMDKQLDLIEQRQQTVLKDNQSGMMLQMGSLKKPLEKNKESYQEQIQSSDSEEEEDFHIKKILEPEQNSTYITMGEGQFPIDLEGKSIEDLLELGFQEISSEEITYDQQGNITSQNTGMDGEQDGEQMDSELEKKYNELSQQMKSQEKEEMEKMLKKIIQSELNEKNQKK